MMALSNTIMWHLDDESHRQRMKQPRVVRDNNSIYKVLCKTRSIISAAEHYQQQIETQTKQCNAYAGTT